MSALGATAQGSLAYTGDAWWNLDAFSARCLGFTDTYPQQLYALNSTQMAGLGYKPVGGALGPSFTKSALLGSVFYDYAVYAHSHVSSHSYAHSVSLFELSVGSVIVGSLTE